MGIIRLLRITTALGILFAGLPTFAEARSSRFALEGIESNFQCAQAKIRNPAAACVPKLTVVPEPISLELTTVGSSKTFEMRSKCRTMRGSLVPKNERFEVAVQRDSGACGGQNLSLQHEAVFNYMRRITAIADDGTGRVRAQINDQTTLILTAQTAAGK